MCDYLNSKQKASLYDIVCKFEREIKLQFGCYDIKDQNLQNFLKANNMHLAILSKSSIEKHRSQTNYLLYGNDKPQSKALKEIPNDSAHNILRHIRNAIAHGLVKKKSNRSEYVTLEDINKSGNKTLQGYLQYAKLLELVNLLSATKHE